MTEPLYKTTIVIWSDYDQSHRELEDLARDATSGESYCSKQHVEAVADPASDPDWDGTEFFDCCTPGWDEVEIVAEED